MTTADRDDEAGTEVDAGLSAPDVKVSEFFGAALNDVTAFGAMLAADGVTRGLIGPREVPRLWERHLVNSGAVAELLPDRGVLVDVGSGAGLPGVVLAAMRPALDVVLVEPMERRVRWLNEVVDTLGLSRVRVVRGRAEELHGTIHADAVTARAVAPMDRLAGWALPLLRRGGTLLALKGQRAASELAQASETLHGLGGDGGEVLTMTPVEGMEETSVVRVVRTSVTEPESTATAPKAPRGRQPSRGGAGRRPHRT